MIKIKVDVAKLIAALGSFRVLVPTVTAIVASSFLTLSVSERHVPSFVSQSDAAFIPHMGSV